MVPGKWPARIVQRISGQGTTSDGDTLIDENGSHWRVLNDAESRYYGSSSSTQIAVIRQLHDGKIY